jgi:hypothetical protein
MSDKRLIIAPVFTSAIPVERGEILERDGFVFGDVLPRAAQPDVEPGLCGNCRNARVMKSDRGSVFYRCLLANTDARFAKYPRLPMVQCTGWEPVDERNTQTREALGHA